MRIDPRHRVVVAEGNYLLLGEEAEAGEGSGAGLA